MVELSGVNITKKSKKMLVQWESPEATSKKKTPKNALEKLVSSQHKILP